MWARVDDGWWCHPKVMTLSLAARGLWVSALSWSCAQRQSQVPASFLVMVGATADECRELAAAGLWEVGDADGWVIHDWAEYQDLSTSERRAEAGRKGGKRSGEARRSKAKQTPDLTSGNVEANPKQDEANAEAGPSLPIPSHPNPSTACTSPQLSVVAEPLDDAAVEIEVRKAIGRAARTIAATDPTIQNPGAAQAAIGQRLRDQHHDEITERVRRGEPTDDVAAWLADPLAGFLEGLPDRPTDARPPLRPVADPVPCDDCHGSGYVAPLGESVARRCVCNPHPAPVAEGAQP